MLCKDSTIQQLYKYSFHSDRPDYFIYKSTSLTNMYIKNNNNDEENAA